MSKRDVCDKRTSANKRLSVSVRMAHIITYYYYTSLRLFRQTPLHLQLDYCIYNTELLQGHAFPSWTRVICQLSCPLC